MMYDHNCALFVVDHRGRHLQGSVEAARRYPFQELVRLAVRSNRLFAEVGNPSRSYVMKVDV